MPSEDICAIKIFQFWVWNNRIGSLPERKYIFWPNSRLLLGGHSRKEPTGRGFASFRMAAMFCTTRKTRVPSSG